ncbi:MAG: choice-of-anchor L domain-containing protein [Bacteroidetes bacterium]|nr:choice-of-anchor L domain-containing protein [Bacteroidota bacterium]
MKRILLVFFLFVLYEHSNAQLTVNGTATPTALVNTILGNGVTISNVTYTGAANGKGTFTATNTNLGMTSGITLSSGNAVQTGNAAVFASESTGGQNSGDPDLDNIVNPQQTYDAAILEFDFSVASDSVQFRFVFGSEEYNDYVNTSFNDVFGFFISGPGIVGNKNIAIIPNTLIPVSINSVNNGGPYPGVSSGPCTNCGFFVDNVGGGTMYLDAFTTVLQAKSAVYPCETYHIKLAVADVTDHILNSAVFIEGGSFSSLGQINLYANGMSVANNDTVWGCPGGVVNLNLNAASNYNWSTGATTQSIVVNVPQLGTVNQYSAFVTNPNFSCFAYTTTLYVAAAPTVATITPNGPTSLCPGGNVTLTANTGQSYIWSTGATTQNIFVTTAGTYTVTVSNGPGCTASSNPLTITVGSATATITGPTALCNGAAANLQANLGQSYLWSTGSTDQIVSASSSGTYTVTVTQAGGCTATASVTLAVNVNPVPIIVGPQSICQGAPASLNAGSYTSYLWSNGTTTQTWSPLATGTYTVTVTDVNGCTGTDSHTIAINPNPTPTISGPTTFCSGSSVNLNAGPGYATYAWSNGASTQIQNLNTSGTYTITVTDGNGCTGTNSVTIIAVANPIPTINGIFSVCAGTPASMDAGAGYLSYLWSNGSTDQIQSPSTSGVYTVTVAINGGCTGTASVNITINNNPTPAIVGNTTICQGAATSFNAGAGFTVYNWSNGSTTQVLNTSAAGTYTVTVTDANGCTASTTTALVVNPLPSPSISGIFSICQGNNTIIDAGNGYSAYVWNAGSTLQTLNVNVSGTYTVTVTDANGCSASTNQVVTINALPLPTITGNPTICSGLTSSLNAGAGYASYSWSNGNTNQSLTTNMAATYTVTVTDNNGCTGSTSVQVIVNPNPVPQINGNTIICQGQSSNFNAGAGYTSYVWSSGGSTQQVNVANSGVYTVTVTDNNGCTGTASLGLNVNPAPTPTITGLTSICQGSTSVIDAGLGYASYVWYNGSNSQTQSISTTGTYTVTVTDLNGCTASTNIAVTVNALPVPVITGNLSLCAGTSSSLSAGNGYVSYLWSNGDSVQTTTVSAAGAYTVTVTDGNGCTGSAFTIIIVNQNPTPIISGPTVICQGNTATWSPGNYSSYQWSNGITAQAAVFGASGTYTVLVTDGNGCTGTAAQTLVVYPTPTPAITGLASICQGGSTIIDAGTGYIQYQWSGGSNSQIVTIASSGIYTVTVTDINGCTASTSINILVNPLPSPSITGLATVCNGDTSQLNAGSYSQYLWNTGSSTQVYNATTTGTYTVTVTDLNGCTGTGSFAVAVNPIPLPVIRGLDKICDGNTTSLNAGNYSSYVWSNGNTTATLTTGIAGQYSVIVTDANGCTASAQPFTVSVLYATAVITANGPLDFCKGGTVTLSANTGLSYAWSNGSVSQQVVAQTSGTYMVTVINQNGCTAKSNLVTVTMHDYPDAAFLYDSTVICGALRVQFAIANHPESGSTVKWYFGDGTYAFGTNPMHDYTKGGFYSVKLVVTTPYGCADSLTKQINVEYPDDPVADFKMNPDLATFLNPKIQFNDLSKNAVAWYWNFDDGEGSFEQNPLHFFKESGTHTVTLTVTNISGCQDTREQEITIAPLWIPNSFTPNGDGKNDLFFTSNYIANVQSFRMVIYNRWGAPIFTSESFENAWDGLDFNGKPSPQGNYIYRIEVVTAGGKAHEFTGNIDLIR